MAAAISVVVDLALHAAQAGNFMAIVARAGPEFVGRVDPAGGAHIGLDCETWPDAVAIIERAGPVLAELETVATITAITAVPPLPDRLSSRLATLGPVTAPID